MQHKSLWASYVVLLGGYTLWSYTQVDPNLVLSNRPFLWNLQNLVWQLGYHQRLISSLSYLILVSLLFLVYFLILRALFSKQLSVREGFWGVGLAVIVLMFSYPALSHDIFNYLMNAKMVLLYQANPHIRVALDFPFDPWLKFMNNVHTPAPYAYGFTALSLIPAFIGQYHLKITILLFRTMMVMAFWLLIKAQWQLADKKERFWVIAFALNPLVLIETVGNIHNDVVMMALLLGGFICVLKARVGSRWWYLAAGSLFCLSVSVKYATLMALVGLGSWYLLKKIKRPISFGGTQAIAHFLPLLTARSQRFLPWYLIWPLSFLPLTKEPLIRETLLIFSFTGLLAYIPYLYTGEFSQELLTVRTMILFMPPLIYLLTRLITARHQ